MFEDPQVRVVARSSLKLKVRSAEHRLS